MFPISSARIAFLKGIFDTILFCRYYGGLLFLEIKMSFLKRFLRWYWRLTKKGLGGNNVKDLVFWCVMTVFIGGVAIIVAQAVWFYSPVMIQEFAANFAIGVWSHIIIIAAGIWEVVRLPFDWLASVNWTGVDRFIHNVIIVWLLRAVIYTFITLLSAHFIFVFISFFIDPVLFIVFRINYDRFGKQAGLFSIIVSLGAGIYLATTSPSVAVVDWLVGAFSVR